jgi:peptidoglycan hydrolase-like protein with peptidoglycan-binding domain
LPLQQFLASKGYFTDTLNGYFGQTTFLAVKAYQKANGLGDDGIVGPMTRSVLNGAQNPSVPSGPTTPLTPSAYTYNFGTKLLMNGSRGDDVKELQRFLNKALGLGLVEDGILGPKTIGVIKEWQKSQGLKDDGIVGPLTKAKMLELAKGFK